MGQGNDAGVAKLFAEYQVAGVGQGTHRDHQAMLGTGGDHHLLPLRIGQRMTQPLRTGLAMSRVTAIRRIIQGAGKIGALGHAHQRATQPVFQGFAVGLDDRQIE